MSHEDTENMMDAAESPESCPEPGADGPGEEDGQWSPGWEERSKAESNLVKHAQREFRAAGWVDDDGNWTDPMQKLMCEQLCELLAVFSSHGHSGFSANYAANAFNTLVRFEPLTPLTGEDWEWQDSILGTVGMETQQNLRCFHVFRDRQPGGPWKAMDSQGRIFTDASGTSWTSADSHTPITFPYTPVRVVVHVGEGD